MNLNKTLGRVATTLVAGTMLAGVTAVPAFAEGSVTKLTTEGNTVTFNKTIDMTNAAGAGVPKGDFTFNVTKPASVGEGETKGDVTDITDEDSNTENGTQIVIHSDGTASTLTGDITFAENAFNAVGTYVYNLQETDGGNPDIDYHESDIYTLRVTVLNKDKENPNGTDFVIGDVTLQKGTDDKTDTITNEYSTYDLTVNKEVTGTWGVKSDKFDFDIVFNNVPESATSFKMGNAETKFTDIYKDGQYKTSFTLNGVSEGATAKNSITFQGLPSGVTYTITEKTDSGKAGNYKTHITTTGDEAATDTNEDVKVFSGDMKKGTGAEDITVTYTNDRTASPATGIVMDIAPYVLLVVVAAACCFVFLRKRRED